MQHLACIMDGNRRFALRHGWKPWVGHRKGVQAVREAVSFCLKRGIAYLSLYVFSLENMNRAQQEIAYLMELIVEYTQAEQEDLRARGVRVSFIGDLSLFSAQVRDACARFEHVTKSGDKLTLQLLLGYGGQQEIVYAAKKLAKQVHKGELVPEEITNECFLKALWTGESPAPDMIIRSGGRARMSNFLLYQAAYAELFVINKLWPELQVDDFQQAYDHFHASTRNFGR